MPDGNGPSTACSHGMETMHLVFNGMIATGMHETPGRLLLTEKAVFLLKDTAASTGAAMFGLVGALLATLFARANAPKDDPGYLADPDLQELTDRDRNALRTTQCLVKYAFAPALVVTSTKMGFSFQDGSTGSRFNGWVHKKKIAAFLQARGVDVRA